MITLQHYLMLAALLFCIGLYGALAKRNAIAVLMGIELMLNSVNINLVAFSRFLKPEFLDGQLFALFTIIVAAAEVAVGLALVIAIYRDRLSVDLNDIDWLKW
ncbi:MULTISPECIES: NADH-quinone oxidoreductase subunit NuoK [Carboxydocella]|uniref:NADH-quinone oxidoreductase subunit K n=2 Tax=Carboxydocella TaxID=178898 RepID=A0A1T4LL47_9FIRM|nr:MULTISPECIES: NADH-quinone oxidoreductase subunit NuoK [Carboxydocella]AVX20507.1 NADH dehydrogenase subunit K [Carboxydocella thermautotrophica]AVX30928.1 NADH dehydrogenase subunit K [Carboxydocella thermautotrophica]SJZ55287.1 NADH dehydrogenase subunit K [Carboxydocella sporoproducens DSM 16521]GAW29675.1 NADH dehydrogenase [Carboxydocella sp. ULO1]GAW31433.1 NADH dehydrogenase [Carboxydocella sp. JDF658]